MYEFFQEIELKEVAKDIFVTPFLTPSASALLLDICHNFTEWKKHTDKYATYDLVFKDYYPTYWEILSKAFEQLKSNLETKGWHVGDYETKATFAVKYTLGQSLKSHVDDSYITGSIKLNSAYEGGVLTFPRQNFSNQEIPIGNLLVWPSQITHPHFSSKIKSGEKYSITIWSDSKKSS
jgi:hypothetical protein